jgi:O-antigen ligase
MEKSWRKSWFVMMLNGFVLICMVIRSQWLGFVIGLGLFFLLTRNLKRTVYGVLAVFVPLLLMYVTNFAIPAPAGRFGTVSVRDMVGRVIAPIDTEAAETFTEDAGINTDTAMFRTVWWVEIWYSVNERPDRAALGYGYGYPLGQLVPYLEDLPVRTPHNAFFFALGYTGWIGVFIFAAFQLELLRLLWKSYKLNGQIFGLLFWFAEAFYSLLTAFFEAPYGAIPFYVVVGCACAPLLLAEKRAPSAEPVPLSPLHGTPLSGRLPGIRG